MRTTHKLWTLLNPIINFRPPNSDLEIFLIIPHFPKHLFLPLFKTFTFSPKIYSSLLRFLFWFLVDINIIYCHYIEIKENIPPPFVFLFSSFLTLYSIIFCANFTLIDMKFIIFHEIFNFFMFFFLSGGRTK